MLFMGAPLQSSFEEEPLVVIQEEFQKVVISSYHFDIKIDNTACVKDLTHPIQSTYSTHPIHYNDEACFVARLLILFQQFLSVSQQL